MNAKELAALLKVHPETIRRMIRNKEIQAEKKGRSFIIPSDEVERLIKESRLTPEGYAIKKLSYLEGYFAKELESVKNQAETFERIDEEKMIRKSLAYLRIMKRYISDKTSE